MLVECIYIEFKKKVSDTLLPIIAHHNSIYVQIRRAIFPDSKILLFIVIQFLSYLLYFLNIYTTIFCIGGLNASGIKSASTQLCFASTSLAMGGERSYISKQ